jgi:phenylacetate-CoA ligase
VSAENLEDEVKKLPVLIKTEVQEHTELIQNPGIEKDRLLSSHTSGTTGSGLVFYETPTAEKERWAVWWRYRAWHGLTQDMWCGYFGGRSVVPLPQSVPPFWRLNYPGRQILFSGYHLSPATADVYLEALDKYAPSWLHGYPSLLSLIAGYLMERGKPLKRTPTVVTTGAENLLPQQKELIQKAFGCPVRQHYGQAESVANISECPEGHLHVDEDFAFVEFLPVEEQSTVYKIVGTNWSNQAFPLIRYDTGDRVRLPSGSPSCRMSGRVVESIDGRKEDYVILPSGVRLGRLDHIFKDLTQIREAQIYQPDRERIIFKIVKRKGYGPDDERRLLDEAYKRVGRSIAIRLEYVDSLERSQTGKLRFVVSELS